MGTSSATISRLREHQSSTPSRWRENAEWRMKNSQQYVSKVLKGTGEPLP